VRGRRCVDGTDLKLKTLAALRQCCPQFALSQSKIKSVAPCGIPAPGLGLYAAATVAAPASGASACGCRFGRGRSFGLSFEWSCLPGENKGEVQEEAGVQLKRARGETQNEQKCSPQRARLAVLLGHSVVVASAFECAPMKRGRSYTSTCCRFPMPKK
jgi:hypothetical protein